MAIRVTTDPAEIDVDAAHEYLSRSYWSPGVPRDVVARAIAGSLTFALLDGHLQIGLARVVTDGATFGYLADVYVLEGYQGRGLGHLLMETVLAHPGLATIRRLVLVTRDAHGLYREFGFKELATPERYMELVRSAAEVYGPR